MPTISVIVPCHNVSMDFLYACINSIIGQTFQDFEVILVDDGSDLVYQNIILEAQKLDKRIHVITQNNQGVSAARNIGVIAAHGEFVIFADADDVLLPNFFSEIIQVQQRTGVDFIIGGNAILDQYKDEEIQKAPQMEILSSCDCEFFKQYMLKVRHFNGAKGYIGRCSMTRLIKRELAIETPFLTSLVIGEDIEWNLKLLGKSQRVCVVYRVWYLYREHAQSTVRKYNEHIIEYLEQELKAFQPLIDLTKNEIYIAYCSRILEDLKQVYTSYLGRKECTLKRKEKKQLIRYIYNEAPWNMVGENRFRKIKETGTQLKFESFLFKMKCFFLFYYVNTKIKCFLASLFAKGR